MKTLPTWWYKTEYFWIGLCLYFIIFALLICRADYPHWDMKPELKAYYLVQAAFWTQQLFVLLFRLEKPRVDYTELVAHHFVTLWLVGFVSPTSRSTLPVNLSIDGVT
jgi:acyl-CoA-dependent ceramide synthase